VQYRGRLMPIVAADEGLPIKREGTQALVVFSDGDRVMGLAVDQIVDIVEDKLDIELATEQSELVGTAVVRGRATEVVNVGHYLPLAHDDWAHPSSARMSAQVRSVLLVDDSAFFRNMLAPVLKASGYKVYAVGSAEEALQILNGNRTRIDAVITDVEMPDKDGFQLVEALRAEPRFASLPVIALSSGVSPDAIQRARKLRIAEFVAKFDRSGLLSALAETQISVGEAA
jgi:two-component system chemotaxis sensor kinase CheA